MKRCHLLLITNQQKIRLNYVLSLFIFVSSQGLRERLKKVEENHRSYLNKDFLENGKIKPLDDKYIIICEIKYLSTFLTGKQLKENQRKYIKTLLNKIEKSDDLDFTEINRPSSIKYIYRLALAEVILDYSKDINKYCRIEDINFPENLETIKEKAKRTIATEGEKGEIEENLKELQEIYYSLSFE